MLAFRFAKDRTLDLVSVGEPLYELSQESDGRFAPSLGGDSSNMAIAAQRLGAKTAYVSRLGDDLFGEALRALWTREGVDHTAVDTTRAGPTGVYFITYRDGAHHFTYLRKGSAASLLTPEHIPGGVIKTAKFLHVSGISLAVHGQAAMHAMRTARECGTLVSLDTNFRPRLWSPEQAIETMEEALALSDIVKTSIEDSVALFKLDHPLAISRLVRDRGAMAMAITEGSAGATGWSEDSGLFKAPAHAVDMVDAAGAGDAFAGALIAFLAEGKDFATAVKWANVAAALSTRQRGCTAGLPTRAAVMAEMRNG